MSDKDRSEQFMDLFLPCQRQLYLVLCTLVTRPQDAEDLLQETARTLWQKFDDFEPGTSFFAWARQIANHKAMNFRRLRSHGVQLLDPEVVEAVAEEAAAHPDMLIAHRDALAHCLERLRDDDRDLVRRRYAQGATRKSVAKELGRPANSVSKSMGRIRLTLLECVRRELAQLDQPQTREDSP